MADLDFRSDVVSAGTCISKGLSIVFGNLFTIVVGAIIFSFIFSVATIIPYIGLPLGYFVLGVSFAGFYYYAIRSMDGKTTTFSDLFAGFSSGGSVFGVVILQVLLWVICGLVAGLILYATGIPVGIGDDVEAIVPSNAAYIIVSILWFVITIIVRLIFYFPLMLIVDKKVSAGVAISNGFAAAKKNFWGLLLLNILQSLVTFGFAIVLGLITYLLVDLVNRSAIADYNRGGDGIGALGIISMIALIPGLVLLYTAVTPFIACSDAAAYREVFPKED